MLMNAELDEVREKVAPACRILGIMGLVDEITGPVSVRLPGRDEMLTRCRGDSEEGSRLRAQTPSGE